MPQEIIHVRTRLMPLYCKDFHCIMGACQYNCCDDGWKIEFSKKDYLKVKRATQDTELEAAVTQGMRRLREREHDGMYAEFCVTDKGRCAFHTEEGLCALQLKCGEDTLPSVCRTFPRLIRNTLAAQEHTLSPACEGVLALLWDLPEGIDFVEEPLERKDWIDYEPKTAVTARFADIRSFCIDILQEGSLRLPQRLLLMGFLLQRLRDADWQTENTVDNWLAQGEQLLHNPAVAAELSRLPRDRQLFIANNYQTAVTLLGESKTKDLIRELTSAVAADHSQKEAQMSFSELKYRDLEEKLEELLGHSDYFFENLMVSVAFQLEFPNLISPEELWTDYVNICNIYSFFRFTSVCGCDREVSKKRLFHILVAASRVILHGRYTQRELRDKFFQHDSATLAHMAILLGG